MTKLPASSAPKSVGSKALTPTKVVKVPQAHGGALLAGGLPGHRGGGGRPPNDHIAWALRQVTSARTRKRLRRLLRKGAPQDFLKLYKMLEDRALGTPTNRVVEAKITLRELLGEAEADADV